MYLTRFKNVFLVLFWIVITISVISPTLADQNDPLQIIDLKNRPADEIIPVIKPMLKPNDAITGTGFQLFIRTDKKTLEEISRLLQAMDKAPRNLIIKVRNNVDAGSNSTDFDASGNYKIGDDVQVVVGDNPPNTEGTKVKVNRTKNTTKQNSEHMLRVVEGGQAFIAAGKIRPYEHRTIIRHRYGVSVYDNIDYQDVTSGFYVTPRLSGNGTVILNVQPHYRSINDQHAGTIDVQEADTTIEAKIGEWVQIGGVDTGGSSKENGILSTSRNSSDLQSAIFIKVEVE